MKLTERQINIRKAFREDIIDNWKSNTNTLMWSVIARLAEQFNSSFNEMEIELSFIPSIGKIYGKTPINAWTAAHYRVVSDALWDGKNKDYAMKLFTKTKKDVSSPTKFSKSDYKDRKVLYKDRAKLKNIAEMNAWRPDRYESTAWNKVK